MDDYFYPYPEKDSAGQVISFPDDDTWADYQKSGGKLSRSDWRRDAVNRFVQRMYAEVKKAKPLVKVGISPFGIWRPGFPPGIAGFDQFEGLFADAKKWFNEGWVDYFAPQLYWPIEQEKQSFPKLLSWWAAENTKDRHLWPGNYTSRVTGLEKGWPATEIVNQIRTTRAQNGATGNIHFSMKALLRNSGGVADALAEVYAEPALVPASPWLDDKPPAAPKVEWGAKRSELRMEPVEKPVRLFVVRRLTNGKWETLLRPAVGDKAVTISFASASERVIVTVIDRAGNESAPASPR